MLIERRAPKAPDHTKRFMGPDPWNASFSRRRPTSKAENWGTW
jgi:hypothetical protein